MPETTEAKPIVVTEGSYNGKPTLTIGEGETDRFAFTFGPAKARKLLAWIEQDGIESVKTVLQNLK